MKIYTDKASIIRLIEELRLPLARIESYDRDYIDENEVLERLERAAATIEALTKLNIKE